MRDRPLEGMLVGCIYLPNGNSQPGPKFAYKLAWFDRLIAHVAELYAPGPPPPRSRPEP